MNMQQNAIFKRRMVLEKCIGTDSTQYKLENADNYVDGRNATLDMCHYNFACKTIVSLSCLFIYFICAAVNNSQLDSDSSSRPISGSQQLYV